MWGDNLQCYKDAWGRFRRLDSTSNATLPKELEMWHELKLEGLKQMKLLTKPMTSSHKETGRSMPRRLQSDNAYFVDEDGFDCYHWRGYDCSMAVSSWGYTQAGQDALLENCPESCATYATPVNTLNGEEACEGHGYDEAQCLSVGCCHWNPTSDPSSRCWSDVGRNECRAPSSPYVNADDAAKEVEQAVLDVVNPSVIVPGLITPLVLILGGVLGILGAKKPTGGCGPAVATLSIGGTFGIISSLVYVILTYVFIAGAAWFIAIIKNSWHVGVVCDSEYTDEYGKAQVCECIDDTAAMLSSTGVRGMRDPNRSRVVGVPPRPLARVVDQPLPSFPRPAASLAPSGSSWGRSPRSAPRVVLARTSPRNPPPR